MPKFSVKKPLTIFVIVIAVVVLGVVAYTNMTPDLLPNMDFPYVMIMTTYPGASPEKVEAEITKPLEQSMAKLEHIKEVTSTSGENYSMLLLEFEEGVNLDTIGVDIQQNIAALSAGWDDMVGAPYVLKINPSMLPVMVAAVSRDGMDTMALTEYLDEELMSKLEGIPGVAQVSTSGTIRQEIHVVLNQELIDIANGKIIDAINGKMDEALADLNKTKAELENAKNQMAAGKDAMEEGKDALTGQLAQGEAELTYQQMQLMATRSDLQDQLVTLKTTKSQLETIQKVLGPILAALDSLEGQVTEQERVLQDLEAIRTELARLDALEADFNTQIASIMQDTSLSQQEKDAAVAALKSSDAYKQMETDQAAVEAKMDLYSVTEATLGLRINLTKTALEELEKRVNELKNILKEQDVDIEELRQQLRDMDKNMAMLDEGIEAIEDGIAQIDSGMLQLKDAQALLSQQKTEGLLQLITGVSEMSVGGTTVENALTQINGGIETLETTREETLKQADLNKLLTMEMLGGILTAQNFSMPAGMVAQDGISYMVSVGDEMTTTEQLQELLLFDMGMEGVEPIYLQDVAAVMVTDNSATTYAKLDGLDSVMLTFEKQSTYATAETTDNILDRFAELENENHGLHFVPLMNQGDYIYMIVEQILSSLLLGALFSVLILFLFLRDWRPTVITLCSIPISVIFAIVLMYFSGVTLNMISLSGLAVAVGMLVDNSVVVIENIYRLRAKGANAVQAAVSGAKQVAGAITSSTLTTVCVFAPIVFIKGITKQLFTDLALTMTYALLASLIVALTLVPAMAAGMLKKEKKHKTTLMDKLLAGYHKAVDWSLRHKAIVLITAAVLLVGSAIWSVSKGFIFMPETDMPSVNVTITMPEGSTMEETTTVADEVLARIDTLEGIETVGAMMGGGMSIGSMGGSGADTTTVTVYITLSDDKASGAEMGQRIEKLCSDLPCEIETSSAMMDMSMLTGSGISLNIYAENMESMQAAAEKASDALAKVDGVTEITGGLEDVTPALHIKIDRNKAMAKGITVAQMYMELAAALQNSATVTTLDLNGTTTDVIVDKAEGSKLTVDMLKDYTFEVTTQTGEVNVFPLSEVGEVVETTSLSAISRLQQRRYLNIQAMLEPGKNVTKATAEAERVIKKLDLGDGVTYEFVGENEMIMEAVEQLFLMLLLGILLVYLVMVAQFQSLKSPFIVMFTIPLAFTGGFAALLICGMELSIVSLIGFVMLVGIIVNNGIVLVDYINQLRAEGMERRAAIIEAGKTRMRPILMTTITTILGLVDMAVSTDAGKAMMQPVAIVCIGGLTYATLMTLFVVPCIYDMMNKKELRVVNEEDLKDLDI